MSHIVEIKTEVRDEQAVKAACARLNLAPPVNKSARLFNETVSGLCIELPGWQYPIVANLQTGQLQYDNYNGHWGEQKHLNAFLQGYAVEKSKIEARKKGHSVSETRLEDGSIRALSVKAGDRVIFGKYTGDEVKLEGEEHIILSESDILAVVERG